MVKGAFVIVEREPGVSFTAEICFGTETPLLGGLLDRVLHACMGRRLAALQQHMVEEGRNLKRISLAPALYGVLQDRIGRERAFQIVEQILVPIGCEEQWGHLHVIDVGGRSPMEQLRAFNERMDEKGSPRFNVRERVRQDDQTCHFRITRCVVNDFFAEAGTPELAKLFCEIDRRFFPEAFPGLRFHRGGSWENTIAYGQDRCEFVFERRAT